MASWFEKRRQRRRRRERMEELIGWIVVPMVVAIAWWGWLQVRDQIRAAPIVSIISGKDRTPAAP